MRGSMIPTRASRSRCAARTRSPSTSTSARASVPPACGGATTRTMARTPWSCGAPPQPGKARWTTCPIPGRYEDEAVTILAVETSCDDTCAAVLDADGTTRANVISSQEAHARFGGVVPEIASRHHLELVNVILQRALEDAGKTLDDIELVAATQGPGLVGALLVGLSTAKALAAARELPFAAVDHLQGHVAANFLDEAFEPPFLCLIASGGHTLLAGESEHEGFEVLGRTLDDAAGEAFDKGARMLGLGYPGGAALERLAEQGDAEAFSFPGSRAARSRGGRGTSRQAFAQSLDFSFAGLKTALLYRLREMSDEEVQARAADLAAS